MRHAVIADIHSNLEAFEAVLEDASGQGIDGYLSVGDVVGYAADPKTCIEKMKSLKPGALIAGNHDWAVAGLFDLEYFNKYAEEAILWTRRVLDAGQIDYLKSFRLAYEDTDFTLVHGSLNEPESFRYIFDAEDARPTIKLLKAPLCFVGHSHVPGIFYSDNGNVRAAEGPKINIERGRQYVINVGSIGQPRDSDPRASYVIYDDREKTIEIRRVGYDIGTAGKKILDAGLPKWFAARIAEGK